MNTGLAMAQFAVLAGAVFAMIGAVLCAVAYPLVRRRVLRLSPMQRARVLVAWSLAPLGLSGMLTLLWILPLGVLLIGCAGEAHTHFCLAHPHLVLDEHRLWAVYLVLALLMVSALWTQLYGWWRTRCLLNSLATVSHYDRQRGIRVMDCTAPLALTAGLSRPEIYISSSLLASLPADMLWVIVAHERAHVRRRDGLIQFVAHIVSLLHRPWDTSVGCWRTCRSLANRRAIKKPHGKSAIRCGWRRRSWP